VSIVISTVASCHGSCRLLVWSTTMMDTSGMECSLLIVTMLTADGICHDVEGYLMDGCCCCRFLPVPTTGLRSIVMRLEADFSELDCEIFKYFRATSSSQSPTAAFTR
jgi:hypothetical protein